jgi:glycosyltransferase involved in cell wall biosynthesis
MLYYVPLEPYRERYTAQLAAPVTGWLERNWRNAHVPFTRVEPTRQAAGSINTGSVLDPFRRSNYCFAQLSELLGMIDNGVVTSADTIYLDDFWTPGFEAIPYACAVKGVRPKVYSFLYAQSVDQYDFTHPMREWMRHFEKGIGYCTDGIFVASTLLKDLVVEGGIAPKEKVHVTGLIFDSSEVMERMPVWYQRAMKLAEPMPHERKPAVVFSSRWDREKNPDFFLNVAARVIKCFPSARFVVCTSSPKLRSNDPFLLAQLDAFLGRYPDNISLLENLTKEQYYAVLCESRVQMNTADQDWVSFTLLEASVAGCWPVYPNYRSFPETLSHRGGFLYTEGDVESAAMRLLGVLTRVSNDDWGPEAIASRQWIHTRFDTTWKRQLRIMGLMEGIADDPYA